MWVADMTSQWPVLAGMLIKTTCGLLSVKLTFADDNAAWTTLCGQKLAVDSHVK